jgi:PIN domain nuclease of toxin-antitoxin system
MGGYLLDTHTAIWFYNGDVMLAHSACHLCSIGHDTGIRDILLIEGTK